MIVINIEQYLIWYYILAGFILVLSFLASWIHREQKGASIPFMWGLIVSILLIAFADVLEPILFGAFTYYNVDWYMFALTAIFALLWYGMIGLGLFNAFVYGGVSE